MRISFIGYGNFGRPLASRLQMLGHDVTLAVRDPESSSLKKALELNPGLQSAPADKAIVDAEVIFICVPFNAVQGVLEPLAPKLRGKIVIDTTNPVGPGLTHGLGDGRSGSELIQSMLHHTSVVKAFSIYGYENLEAAPPVTSGVSPVMMICGDDTEAKKKVSQLSGELGWETLDVGGLDQALHLEHLTLLWIKHVRVSGNSSNLVWAALRA